MLTPAELKAFLSLVYAFSTAVGLSDRQLSRVLDISYPTLSRWIRMHVSGQTSTSVYRSMANPVRLKIERLNYLDSKENLYATLVAESAAAKCALLTAALQRHAL